MNKFFNSSDIVLFQGDSVTDCNRDRNTPDSLGYGYPSLVSAVYNTLFPNSTTTFINRAVSGDRVRNLLARYREDIYNVQPTFISILIGINDVWRAFDQNDPCPPERFREEYAGLLTKIRADFPAVRIMLIDPFVLRSLPDRAGWHADLDPKQKIVKELAERCADYYLPLQAILNAKTGADFTAEELTADGVHPSRAGHAVIAAEYLKKLEVL